MAKSGKNFFRARVLPVLARLIPDRVEDKSKGIYKYGNDNALPNEILRLAGESGTLRQCIKKWHTFVQADGFTDKIAAVKKVNKTQTADQLLSELSSSVAYFRGVCLHIKRELTGTKLNITGASWVPFGSARKCLDGSFKVNPNYGAKDYKDKEDIEYPAFRVYAEDPTGVKEYLDEQKKYGNRGEILYLFLKEEGQTVYPVPEWMSGDKDIKADAELSCIEYENAVNSYISSLILTIIGEVDDEVEDDKGKTEADYLDETLEGFTGKKKDTNGAGGRGGVTVLSAKTKDEVPDLKVPDLKASFESIHNAVDRVARKVARHCSVPSFLVSLESATGFDTKRIVDQIQLFNGEVNKYQRMITEALTMLWPEIDWTISTLNPITYIPDKVWDKLTDDEIRNIGGFEPLPQQASSENEIVLSAMNTMSPLVANKVLEEMTSDEIRALVGMKALTEEQKKELQTRKGITTDGVNNEE